MLDIKIIRDDKEAVKKAMRSRNSLMDLEIDELLNLDKEIRQIILEEESLKATQNTVNKQIPQMKKAGQDISDLLLKMKELSDKVSVLREKLHLLEEKRRSLLLSIPNIPHKTVPLGEDETKNEEVRRFGEPTKFSFEPKPHWEIGKKLEILDSERAAKVTGARFHFYKALGAKLERAIMNFFLDTHAKHGYTEIFPPFLVNAASMIGTGQLPKFEDDAFKVYKHNYFLVPTAEVPVTNFHRNEIFSGKDLPINYCAFSTCFRAEAGAAGKDTKGLIRQHQFNKVELVKFSRQENSYEELEKLTNDAERVLQLLELPYRVVCLSSGDLGFSAAKTYDIEVWMPSYGRYLEISSCSNFEDYQARRASIRYKDDVNDKAKFVHTLNGSGVAIGRTVAAILENFQTAEGEVIIPKMLKEYIKD